MRSRFAHIARRVTLNGRHGHAPFRSSAPTCSNLFHVKPDTSVRMYSTSRDDEKRQARQRSSSSAPAGPIEAMIAATPLALLGIPSPAIQSASGSILPTSTSIVSTSAAVPAPLVGAGIAGFLKVAPVISCQAMWVAPYPTIKEVVDNKTTAGLPPLPYFSMFANGYLWFCYGISAGMDLTIMLPNITGMFAGAYYSSKFMAHNSGQYNLQPYYFGTAASLATVTGMLALLPTADAQNALGYLGCVIVVAMFSGPLAVIKEVIETKSTKSLPFPMAVATVVNCTLWASFGGLVIHDPFIWAPNALGLMSGLTQLALFAKYGFHKDDAEPAAAVKEEKAE